MKYTNSIEIKYFINGEYFFSEYHHEKTTLTEIKNCINITMFLLEIPKEQLEAQIKFHR